MDFKEYASGGQKQPRPPGGEDAPEKRRYKLNDFDKTDVDSVTKVYNKYKDKSDGAVMDDLAAMVTRERRAGKLTDQDLDTFAKNAGRMMTPEQRNKLQNIIKALKDT